MSVFVVLGCAIAMSIVHIAWYEWVALARRRHAIVCRDAYLINVGANVAATLVYLAVCWWALGPEWLGVAVAAPTLLVLDWTMFRLAQGRNPSRVRVDVRSIEDVYAEIPSIECRGKCQASCGPIDLTTLERRRLRARGVEIPVWTLDKVRTINHPDDVSCPALGAFGQCTVYELRPLICRLWGVVESMRCPFNCTVDRVLTDKEAFDLMVEATRIGGHPRYGTAAATAAALPEDAEITNLITDRLHAVTRPDRRR